MWVSIVETDIYFPLHSYHPIDIIDFVAILAGVVILFVTAPSHGL
jgi:hypothetical protein